RNRFDWPMGLLRWGDDESRETHAVAIVFRRWTGDRPIFVADIFSAQGEKLGDDLPLVDPDTPRLEASAFVSAASASDGRAFLLVGNRRSGDRRLLSQRLYEVVLDGLDTDGRSLRVSVRDDRGSLPDARVIDVEAREAFLTDADGVARLIDRPTTPFALEVRADDHIRRELWVQPEECHLDVELDRGSGFRIRLLDPLGASLDAVRVRPRQGGHFHTVERRLDADGAVEVAGLQAGDAELTFLVDGYRTARLNVDLPVAGEVVDLGDLVLDPGGVVEGRLTLEDGTPLADAVAVAHRPSRSGRLGAEYHGDLLTASCDADGRFRLGGLDPGDTCIRIDHPSTPPRALAISTLGENEQRDLGTITIGPAIHLHGRVEDSADQPLEGESVELRAGDADDPCQRLTTVTDTQGRFAFDAVGFGAWTAVVRRDGQVVARRTLTLDDETDPVADLGTLTVAERRLAGAVRIGGLHAAGGGLSIEPRRATAAPTPLFVTEHGTQRLINDRPIALGTPVDGDGSFSLTGVLPAGPAVVTYRTPTGDAFRHIVHLPSVEKGQASTDRLDLDFDGIELRGIAQLVDGRPAVGARLILHLDDLAVRETATDAAGRFRLASAPPRGRLVAHLDALVGEATVGPDRRVEIELRPTAYR
ncbi:MAG: carboxypeptidase-like regulatory domain-containing protein, partial [Acidobacteriota bacterium]